MVMQYSETAIETHVRVDLTSFLEEYSYLRNTVFSICSLDTEKYCGICHA